MNNFRKYDCDFFINSIIKENDKKSVYSALMKRSLSTCGFEHKEDVVIIKISRVCEQEIKLLNSLKHQGLPRIFMMWEEERHIIIIQEKIIGLSLLDYTKQYKNIPNNRRIMFAYSLAKIIKYIHSGSDCERAHGDISPNNIIISSMDQLYLIDFGSSFQDRLVKKEKFYYGTKGYFSPKLIESPMSVDRGIDIYSFAMILKLLEVDKISIEAYEVYKKCIDKSNSSEFDISAIMEELLYLLN